VTFAEYQTPAGYRDTPFIYVYDPNTLRNLFPFVADGNDQLVCTQPVTNQSVRLLYGEQFILGGSIIRFCPSGRNWSPIRRADSNCAMR